LTAAIEKQLRALCSANRSRAWQFMDPLNPRRPICIWQPQSLRTQAGSATPLLSVSRGRVPRQRRGFRAAMPPEGHQPDNLHV